VAHDLFNSPQKQWMREFFWLPILESFKARSKTDLRYLTFAGPKGYDIDFFVNKNIFTLDNVRVWERSKDAADALIQKFGLDFHVKVGEAFDLSKAQKELCYFPHSVVNLDFTNGAFSLASARHMPHKMELISNVISAQREHAESFLLLFAVAATPDVDSAIGKAFVQKMAFDIATRFGHTEPLFNLTRAPDKTYAQVLAAVLPCAVIRLGGEQYYDTQCAGKALYSPGNSKRTSMLCLAFEFTYDHPPLSETNLQTSTRFEQTVVGRQQESLAMPLLDVNGQVKKIRRNTRAR
jgi:hypothetical protein